MITGQLKRDIDKLWLEFWQGGITNPLTVIEQITFLMFIRLLDIQETADERRTARNPKYQFKHRFRENEQELRWKNLKQYGSIDELLPLVRDRVFKHIRELAAPNAGQGNSADNERTFASLMKDAQLMIVKPSLLAKAIAMIDELPLTEGDRKGDVYEYLLSKLTTAGINGQFRTPRHIIDLMVEMLDPQPSETIADPACGTGGFLVQSMEYLRRKYTSQEGKLVERDPETGKDVVTYTGDKLSPDEWTHIQKRMFHGLDFDATMLRLAAMNLMLHGVEDAGIRYGDTLSSNYAETSRYDVILANPPFKGSLDFEDTNKTLLSVVKTKKTELLFVALILRMLKPGGRAAVIVPDGVLFSSSTAHRELRTKLIDENQLEAIISLPSGVFKPYAGVSTGVLVFSKGGETKDVLFVDVQADGYSLDDKRELIDENDLPLAADAWAKVRRGEGNFSDRTAKAFTVGAEEIRDNGHDLSIGRYKEARYEEEEFDPPRVILKRMQKLEADIQKDLTKLEELLG
jgi:type I restriction enzyme M protein